MYVTSCFHPRLSARHAATAPASAVAELGVVRASNSRIGHSITATAQKHRDLRTRNMKPTTKAALLGAFLAAVASFLGSSLMPHVAKAGGAIGGEQYKVISTNTFEEKKQLEQTLNTLAADGWKVRTGVGSALVLFK